MYSIWEVNGHREALAMADELQKAQVADGDGVVMDVLVFAVHDWWGSKRVHNRFHRKSKRCRVDTY